MKKKKAKSPFEKARSAENDYARDLRRIAHEVGRIIARFNITDLSSFPPLRVALDKYADILRPWAQLRAELMVEKADHQDKKAWAIATENAGQALRQELKSAPTGQAMRRMMAEQVDLITSLPKKAAERVHELVLKNIETSGRGEEIVKEIQRSGKVAASRANLIARTEVARASSVLTQARAEYIGSDGYIWRTVHDSDVRPSHRKMEGKYVAWDSPPTLDGLTGHAGTLPNCRCYAEPIIPKELFDDEKA